MMVSRGGGRRNRKLLLMGTEFQVFKMKRIPEIDGGDINTALTMYLILLNCVLKNN